MVGSLGVKTARDKIPVQLIFNPTTLISYLPEHQRSRRKVRMIHAYLLEKKESGRMQKRAVAAG